MDELLEKYKLKKSKFKSKMTKVKSQAKVMKIKAKSKSSQPQQINIQNQTKPQIQSETVDEAIVKKSITQVKPFQSAVDDVKPIIETYKPDDIEVEPIATQTQVEPKKIYAKPKSGSKIALAFMIIAFIFILAVIVFGIVLIVDFAYHNGSLQDGWIWTVQQRNHGLFNWWNK
ncbi:hypothetical protein MCFN_02460 [Mycoplasmopsis californica]|uniref:Uncharacterized protein n=1 Tax=Mycoplasmopsis californica TaxID=2113 RepID=A0A059XRF9_9BACT|nr:hypothetical protein [Mycoplasmopsis californica]AIA29625.1 hypothetical protein MCFN_02460 [Mycoplasmopsis californica]